MVSSYSYAVFKYVKDAQRDWTVPVGVALWSNDTNTAWTRFISKDESLPRISKTEDIPYIDLVVRKLKGWLATGELPYQSNHLSPGTDQWWRHVKDLLVHRVRISEPLSVDCHDPEAEIEPLFASLVRPEPSEDATERIETLVRRALGESLTGAFRRGQVPGFEGKPVNAMRVLNGTSADVIVDAVNLSSSDAPRQADEVVGKLQRARSNGLGPVKKERPVWAIVGYVSSPGGLNGEAYLKNWIEQAGDAKVFDLIREGEKIQEAAREALLHANSLALPEH
jgi:hypothetical protein